MGYIEVSNRREKICLHISHFEIFIHTSVNIILKIIICLLVNTFLLFSSLIVIRNFRGTCLSIEMLKAYMARESLITPVLNPVPSLRGALVGLVPQTKLHPSPQSEK